MPCTNSALTALYEFFQLRLIALYKSLIVIVTSFIYSKCIYAISVIKTEKTSTRVSTAKDYGKN